MCLTEDLKTLKREIMGVMLLVLGWPINYANRKVLKLVIEAIGSTLPFGFPLLLNHLRRGHNERNLVRYSNLSSVMLRLDWTDRDEDEEGGFEAKG
jgi:hypothetical protein